MAAFNYNKNYNSVKKPALSLVGGHTFSTIHHSKVNQSPLRKSLLTAKSYKTCSHTSEQGNIRWDIMQEFFRLQSIGKSVGDQIIADYTMSLHDVDNYFKCLIYLKGEIVV